MRRLVGRRGRIVGACAVLVTLSIGASACSHVADTTSLSADQFADNTAVPTTAMLRSQLPTSTTTTSAPLALGQASATSGGLTATLSSLVSQFAANPQLVGQLNGLDLAGLAGLLNIDLDSILQLGLSLPDIQNLAATVTASPADLVASLAGGSIDPATLVGLLAGSVDLNSIAGTATGALVQALVGSLANLSFTVSPEVTLQLGELLDSIDPDSLGNFAATPANSALVALLLSAVINSNPLVTQQLLESGMLDPLLQSLLGQLQELGKSLGDAATIALLQALNDLIPGGIPGLAPLLGQGAAAG